jgi:Domain of unknown function (DUF222)/HNH endonuclease
MALPATPPAPADAAEAAAMARAALAWLATADTAALTTSEQAGLLRALEDAGALHTAARASVLSAFTARAGYQDDGHCSARAWLAWQTRITGAAASAAVGWTRRLAAHPAIRDALAAAEISASWARVVCDWTDTLPDPVRPDADAILLAAAASGADLADLGALAEEMRRRAARPDTDTGGFAERWVRLEQTLDGAGRLAGDLTPQAAAALRAVLDALGKRAGPEDLRTRGQRDHDALEEACRRLIAAGCLPERAGQPTHIQLVMTLDQLLGLDRDSRDPAANPWPGSAPAGPGAECDATIIPIVTSHVDPDVLGRLAAALLRPDATASGADVDTDVATRQRAERTVRQLIVQNAAELLSGPQGLAAWLRTNQLDAAAASVSLPLDIGAATDTIPAHLRRLVIFRDRRCRFPGCDQPACACQPHHLIPRSKGGRTSLSNLILLCAFHHLIAVHRWGWGIALNPDGTVTATCPHTGRTFRGHDPPPARAA